MKRIDGVHQEKLWAAGCRPERDSLLEMDLLNGSVVRFGAGLIAVVLDGGLDVLPNGRARIVKGQKQLGLLGDVLEVAHQRGTGLARLKVLFTAQVVAGFKELGQLVLKFRTGHGLSVL
jgi:hypothetical protein